MIYFRRQLVLVVTLFAGVLAATPSHGAIIANYTFDGNSAASSDTDLGTTASDITFPGITNAGNLTLIDSNRIRVEGPDTALDFNPSNLATAMSALIGGGNYFEFTLTIPATLSVNLSSLGWSYTNNNGFDSAVGVYSDKTGYISNNQLYGYFDNDQSGGTVETSGTNPIVLTLNPLLQNLSDTTVTFRYYLLDQSSSPTRIQEFDNIVLNAEITPIPEPSALLLGGFILLGYSCKRVSQRRRGALWM